MQRTALRLLSLLAAATFAPPAAGQTARGLPAPPVARVIARTDTMHGDVRVDNYFWLRERQNPEVIRYLEAENRYTDTAMAPTRRLQETLFQEIMGRTRQTDTNVPDRMGPYLYYSRTEEGKQYPIFARRRGSMEAPEEVLLDANQMAEGKRFFSLGGFEVSPDHGMLAFSVDTTGSERFTLMVKDLRTGRVDPEHVDSVYSGLAWAADNRTLFYTKTDSAHRPDRVFRHTVGTPAARDQLVFHDPDVLFRVGVYRTRDNAYVVIASGGFTTSDARVVPADRPGEPFRLVAPREKDVLYTVEHQEGRFVIRTNADGANNFKLVTAPESDPSRANWRELVPERPTVLLATFDVFRDYLVLYERTDALRQIRVRDIRGGGEHVIAFDEPVYTAAPGSNPEYDTRTLRFGYQSMVTPYSVYDYDMATRRRELRKQTEVLGGYDPSLYATERTWARAADGAMVPVSLVYKKPLVRDGSRPLLLYAYGSYGTSTDPTFSTANLSLLDRGVVFAIAHVRGGQEMGRAWYDQGKMLNKRNTFSDFIAAAEHLVAQRYTSSQRLAIRGVSAGGLLMGAVVNMRPDLFRVVVADVPFVDVINTMADASIPLTTGEWEQWGNPANEAEYRYLLSYSPYENVERKAYPVMLVTAGLNDPRVPYWEPAKWVARLRTMKTDDNLLLLRTNMGAGHGGSSGRYDAVRETAFRYAFILHHLGVER
ncbi:MAG TPA: S9 family peptidase [Longimicrobium sp.]|jgi:oligopeptidase B|uniref:S9 family peptidase n=1 Tax=Longimicrobium sp. TaxID=2029185 RepID=UPI002EDAFEF6